MCYQIGITRFHICWCYCNQSLAKLKKKPCQNVLRDCYVYTKNRTVQIHVAGQEGDVCIGGAGIGNGGGGVADV